MAALWTDSGAWSSKELTTIRTLKTMMSTDDNEVSPNDDNDQGHFQARFWYNNETDYRMSLRGVLFTDTGPYRGAMRQCYHRLFYFMMFI